MATKPLNILCLDGGGVRGLSSLLILQHLMQQLAASSELDAAPLPCEVFDIICGTSTGGIIALMLGRLRMNVDDAIACYLEFSRTVFEESRPVGSPQPSVGFWNRLCRRTKERKSTAIYDASKLEKWMKQTVARYGGDKDASLQDPLDCDGTSNFCRTFVVATTQVYGDAPPKCFRTFTAKGRPADPCTIWEAARATTAASPFFDPATFGSPPATYIDGSFSGSNNPSRLAIDEATSVFPSRTIGCFLSLGTGVPDIIAVVGDLDNIAKACMDLIRSCEGVHNEVWRDFARKKVHGLGDAYFRFSVDRGLGKVKLDEWNREVELTGITGGYMRGSEEEEKAMGCIETLKARAAEIAITRREEAELL